MTTQSGESPQPSRQRNAFGALRLLLASLVIVAHTPELIDGDRHREILFRLTGGQTFGNLAVNGFFLLSGLLISSSWLNSAGVVDYMRKRIARIYPAFAICSLMLILIVGPLVGGYHPHGFVRGMAGALWRILTLQMPVMIGAFHDTPYAYLNGAAWTIKYEFACYLLVIQLGLMGWLRSGRRLWLLAAILLVAHTIMLQFPQIAALPEVVLQFPRLAGLFVAGAAIRPHFNRMTFTGPRLAIAALVLGAALMSPVTATIGCATAGAYLLFGAGVLGGRTVFHLVNNDPDISYGLYLYGWPVEKVVLWVLPSVNIVVAGVATWVIAAALGLASWLLIEQPVLNLVRKKR